MPTALPKETILYLNDFADAKRVMLAGHLPLLGYLASELLINTSEISFYFEPGAVCHIYTEQPHTFAGHFRWFLTPEHLRLLAQT